MLFGFMNTTGENISKIAPSSRNRNFHTLQRIEVDEHDQECILVSVRMFFFWLRAKQSERFAPSCSSLDQNGLSQATSCKHVNDTAAKSQPTENHLTTRRLQFA